MKLGKRYKNIIKSIVVEEKKIDEARGKSLNIPDFNDEKYKQIFDKVFYHIQQKGVYDMSIFTVWDIISYLEQNPSYYKEMAHILDVDEITNDLEYELLNYFDEYSNDKNSLAYKIFYELSMERIEGVFINLQYEMIDNKIYREISTPKDIKQVLEYSEKNGLGCCWAKRYDMATAYYGNEDIDNNLPTTNNYVLVGELTDKNINWVATLILRAIYEEENEIRLKADVPVKLVKIIDRNTNKRYNVNKIFSSGNKLAYDQYNESKNSLNENVNTQYLYHGMWKDQYEFCKKQNKLFGHSVSETFYGYNKNGERIGRRFKGISTSRNAQVSINFMENIIKEYTNEWKSNPSAIFSKRIGDNEKYVSKDDDLSYVVLVLDYNKIKQNNKIVPLSFLAGSQKDYYGDEQEELIIGDLKNLNNYVVDVMEFNNNINKKTLQSKPLEESFVKNPFTNEVECYYSKSESEVKQIIKNKFNDIPVRVLYDFVNKVYIFGNANTLIHVDLIDKMKQYGKTEFSYRYPTMEEERYKWMDKNCAMFKIINTNDYRSYTRYDGYRMGVIGKLDSDMYVILRDNTLAMERSRIFGNFVPDELAKCKKVPMLQNVKFVNYDIRSIGMINNKEQLPQNLVNESFEPKLNDNFWKWFGKSKVVDENGNPLVVYHGTRSQFAEFDKKYAKNGFFFTTEKRKNSVAGYYAYYYDDNGSIMPCYIKLENPLIVHRPNGNEDDIARANGTLSNYDGIIVLYDDKDDWEFSDYDYIEKRRKPLTIKNGEVIEYIVFDPNNIKSVNNNGNWSTTSNNINESVKPHKQEYGILYHGTNSKFLDFKEDYQNGGYLGNGFYFTMSKSMAQSYGKNIIEAKLNYNSSFYFDSDVLEDEYVKQMLNTTKADDDKKLNIYNLYSKLLKNNDIYQANSKLFDFIDYYNGDSTKILIECGYDSIDNIERDSEFVVFNSNQIKILNNINESASYGGANWQNSMDALGNVPATIGHNLFMTMFPYHFLSLCPKYNYGDDKFFDDYIESKKPIGIPFLIVDFNFDTKTIEVQDHEGRHRVTAISRRKNGNIVDIPVALLYSTKKYPQIPSIDELRKNWTIVSQKGDREYNVGQFSVYNSFPKSTSDKWFNLYENKLSDIKEDTNYILSADSYSFSCYPPQKWILIKCNKNGEKENFNFYFDNYNTYVKLCRSLLARFEKGFKPYKEEVVLKKIDSYDGNSISKEAVMTILKAYYGNLLESLNESI